MKDRMALIFANIDNSTMDLFTSARSLGALPFGGRYRLIDFTLSNLVNGYVETVGVAVREKYQSLLDHIGIAKEWDLDRRQHGLSFLPPFTYDSASPYDTKLKALIGSEIYLRKSTTEYIFLCEPDVICNMDLDEALRTHISSNADISFITVPRAGTNHFGTYPFVVKTDENNRVIAASTFHAGDEFNQLCTGICIMKRTLLLDLIKIGVENNYLNLDTDVVAPLSNKLYIAAIPYGGNIFKIRTLKDYYEAGMCMLEREYRRDVFYRYGRIYTKTHSDVPVLYGLDSDVKNSLIADGSSIEGSVYNSIIFRRVKIGKHVRIKNSIIMQDSIIEDGAVLEYCITDKNVRVTANSRIIGEPDNLRLLKKGQTYSF